MMHGKKNHLVAVYGGKTSLSERQIQLQIELDNTTI